ncbi:hypothetical protein GCM10027275_11960 [Rhabdobacter roseus]|uniref:Uncharacterized protein n=1 Tax=Rhabdobacter roseus TaxID=1655419 RepID=A0A840TSY1_9BACT|nr:hypothetical protein [Rhabdobacter roseus]
MIEVKEVIVTDMNRRGDGKTSAVRRVLEVYTKEGILLANMDSMGNFSIEQMLDFGQFCRNNSGLTVQEALHQFSGGVIDSYH